MMLHQSILFVLLSFLVAPTQAKSGISETSTIIWIIVIAVLLVCVLCVILWSCRRGSYEVADEDIEMARSINFKKIVAKHNKAAMPESAMKGIKERFNDLDRDESGVLEEAEVIGMVLRINEEPKDQDERDARVQEAKILVQQYGDGKGYVEFE